MGRLQPTENLKSSKLMFIRIRIVTEKPKVENKDHLRDLYNISNLDSNDNEYLTQKLVNPYNW